MGVWSLQPLERAALQNPGKNAGIGQNRGFLALTVAHPEESGGPPSRKFSWVPRLMLCMGDLSFPAWERIENSTSSPIFSGAKIGSIGGSGTETPKLNRFW